MKCLQYTDVVTDDLYFSEENLKGADFADQMNLSNLGILHSTLSTYLDPDNKLKDTFFHFLESSDIKVSEKV